jgi:hypothetical protein
MFRDRIGSYDELALEPDEIVDLGKGVTFSAPMSERDARERCNALALSSQVQM